MPDLDWLRGRLQAARAGDRAALGEVLECYTPVLLGRVRWLMGLEARRRAETVDYAGDVLVEVMQRLPGFELRDEASFVAWLVQIARSRIGGAVRRRREERFATLATSMVAAIEPVAAQTAAEEAAARGEDLARMADVLEEMPEERRTVIELRDFEERSFAEIAQAMGRSENAVQLLHARALAELSRRLGARQSE
ncbi:MAG: sigma-70 family RNA polymerase sigma factor [Planctomycetota bacterium]